MITIFANMRINTVTRLQHLKDSFLSFNTISDNWLINIRGNFRDEALEFLRQHLGQKMEEFNLLDDSRGWAENALDMLESAKYDYVFVWNEDHMNIAPQEIYPALIQELKQENVDSMFYSWWSFGKLRKGFEQILLKSMRYIDTIEVTKEMWEEARAKGHCNYLVSLVSIFKKVFFENLLRLETKKLPGYCTAIVNKSIHFFNKSINFFRKDKKMIDEKYFNFINKYFFRYRLINFAKETPFDLEKNADRIDLLPIKIALPKQELFASIDDDFGMDGYSLVKRGLYDIQPSKPASIIKNIEHIIVEIQKVLSDTSEEDVHFLIKEILRAQKVFVVGAGRVGLTIRGFAMRLSHLGLNSHNVGDVTVPAIKEHDLLLIASGSGETQTIYDIASIAKRNGSRIALITGNLNSRIAQLADVCVEIKAPSKVKAIDGFQSIQPMTTLNEQCLSIFFDAVVLKLMNEMSETHDTMWARHSSLE